MEFPAEQTATAPALGPAFENIVHCVDLYEDVTMAFCVQRILAKKSLAGRKGKRVFFFLP